VNTVDSVILAGKLDEFGDSWISMLAAGFPPGGFRWAAGPAMIKCWGFDGWGVT
jgi:hypothetical protein